MVDIGGMPLLLHVMQCYDRWGFRRFVLCTGWRGDVISSYFLNFPALHQDFTLDLRDRQVSYHQVGRTPEWEVTIAHTGRDAMTGARIARAVGRYLGEAEHFAVTYGDGLTDVDLDAEFLFHRAHGRLGTMLGVHPPRNMAASSWTRAGHCASPRSRGAATTGSMPGFSSFAASSRTICPRRMAGARGGAAAPARRRPGLQVFRHDGFWSSVDTIRDRDQLVGLWEKGAPPWVGPDAR